MYDIRRRPDRRDTVHNTTPGPGVGPTPPPAEGGSQGRYWLTDQGYRVLDDHDIPPAA